MGTSVYGMNLSSYDTAATFGTSAPTPSAFGAGTAASSGGMFDTLKGWGASAAGFLSGEAGLLMLSGGMDLFRGGMGIWQAGINRQLSDIQASAYRFAGEQQAAELKRQGDAAVRNIGIVQQQGLDAATLRYNALGDEIARQRVAAAGSGIDLSSRTVGKAEQTSRKNAAWDVSRISRNTKIAADNYNEQAEAAFRNSAYAKITGDYQAKVTDINGDLQHRIGMINGISQMVTGGLKLAAGGFMI